MPQLKVNLDELCDAYAMNDCEVNHYLNLETGEIIMWMASDYRNEAFEEEL